jgi:hypothetical protein
VVALTSSVGSLVEWQMLPNSIRALSSSSDHLRAPSELLRALSEHPPWIRQWRAWRRWRCTLCSLGSSELPVLDGEVARCRGRAADVRSGPVPATPLIKDEVAVSSPYFRVHCVSRISP